MEYFWWLYLATRLDSFVHTFSGMIFFPLVFFFIIGFAQLSTDNEFHLWERLKGYRYLATTCIVIGIIGTMITPSRKDAMFIAGGVGVIEAAKAVKGSAIAQTSVKIIEEWLNTELAGIKKKNDEKK